MPDDRRPHAVDRAELDHQLGGGGGVVGDVVDAVATGRHDGGDAGVALRPHPLGQCLVDDLTHDVAAELPALAVQLEKSGARQVVEVGDAEVLTHLLGEPRQRPDVLVVPEDGGVVEDRPLDGRQLVDAGGDEGPQRAGQLGRVGAAGGQRRQLHQEQRVAAAAIDERLDAALVVVGRLTTGQHAADQLEAVGALERAQGHLDDERPFDRRRPHHVRIGPLPGDEQEGAVAQRTHDDGEVVAQHRVGPLQVVHPQHRHARLGVAAQHLGDHGRQPVTGAGGVEAVELGRMAEQEEADVEEALELGVARRQPPDLLGPLLHRAPHRLGTGVTLQPEEAGQGRHHGRPHVLLAVRSAGRAHDDRLGLQRVDDLLGQPRLAGSGLADDRHDAAVAVAHELDGGVEQRPFLGSADERHVPAQRSGTGGQGAGDEPRLLDPVAARGSG